MEFCRICDAGAGSRQIPGCLSDLDSFQGQLGKTMIGEGREKHLLNKTNPGCIGCAKLFCHRSEKGTLTVSPSAEVPMLLGPLAHISIQNNFVGYHILHGDF